MGALFYILFVAAMGVAFAAGWIVGTCQRERAHRACYRRMEAVLEEAQAALRRHSVRLDDRRQGVAGPSPVDPGIAAKRRAGGPL